MSEPYTRGEEAFYNLFDENEAPEELDFEGPEFQTLNVDPYEEENPNADQD